MQKLTRIEGAVCGGLVLGFLFVLPVLADNGAHVPVGTFVPAERELWEEKSFKEQTAYSYIAGDDTAYFLKAHCDDSASALHRRIKIDLTKTPVLEWSWKIDAIHDGLDETSKDGDDYAARVYVVHKGFLPWDIKAVNYVWANTQPRGKVWPNAFSDKAIMIAQQSGRPDNADEWIHESRNVRDDFKRTFGMDIKQIDGVAVMTDCDNNGGTATGYYRRIRFTAPE